MTIDIIAEQCVVARSALADVLRGAGCPRETVTHFNEEMHLHEKETLVCWVPWSNRPVSIVIPDSSEDEFFAWLTTYHPDICPITSWCNLFTISEWKKLSYNRQINVRLRGLEAAWIGLIIAEAMIANERHYDKLSLTSCLTTIAFPVARSIGLHDYNGRNSLQTQINPIKALNSSEVASVQHGTRGIIYDLLGSLRGSAPEHDDQTIRLIYNICCLLDREGGYQHTGSNEIDNLLLELFNSIPGYGNLKSFRGASAEDYIRMLRLLKDKLGGLNTSQGLGGAFIAGFIISQVGGAERDLRLADQFNQFRGDVLLWSAMLGGIGAETYWSSAFSGLGRLVARELTRPFRFSDSPNFDISYSEFSFLQRTSGMTIAEIRTANRNLLNIGTQAGVSVNLSIRNFIDQSPSNVDGIKENNSKDQELNNSLDEGIYSSNELQALTAQLTPYLIPLIRAEIRKSASKKQLTKNQTEFKLK